jgi:phospholipase C
MIRVPGPKTVLSYALILSCLVLITGCGGVGSNGGGGGGTQPAPTATLTASPTSITNGQTATLTWTTTNATGASIDNGIGGVQPVSGGSITVHPSTTTTYTLTATGPGGTATAQATVTVGTGQSPPTATLVASPTSIMSGQTATLTWTTTNATSASIDNGIGAVQPVSGGSITVQPSKTTTYTLTATGPGGTVTAQAIVTVGTGQLPPTATLVASPTSIMSGQTATLTWTTTNATSASIDNGIGAVQPVSGGSITVQPSMTTTYTLTATGPGGTVTAQAIVTVTGVQPPPTATLTASPTSITNGQTATLTWATTNATSASIDNGIGAVNPPSGGSIIVQPSKTTTYTLTATGPGGTATAQATITVQPANLDSIQHVVFMLQENRSFDSYFGMLNPYRVANGWTMSEDNQTYTVDGIDDKLTKLINYDDESEGFQLFKTKSSCLDDMTSSWLESYGDVSRYDFTTHRPIVMDGFVHTAENYAKLGIGDGQFTDLQGKRAMAYYDQDILNYYYYMAAQFAISDRWFSPVSSKSTPNRIATYTGGTTQGLVFDPYVDDKQTSQMNYPTIFSELDAAGVSWKIYYLLTDSNYYPVTTASDFSFSLKYLYRNPNHQACVPPTVGSQAVGDPTDSFCIDPKHIAPVNNQYATDVQNNTLPSFAYIEAAYGHSDEHPGSGQSILFGQAQVASLINALMQSPSWNSSVFFLSYDEAGGPYDHVPPVPNHSNDFTDKGINAPDISTIAVNADSYWPCLPPMQGVPTWHCDLNPEDPGANSNDAPAQQGFAAQLGFRVPNMVVSPFVRKHYVSHIPMDHTAILKFVENRFIGSGADLTNRDAAQPGLLNFFDFTNVPWATPPAPPTPNAPPGNCDPINM